ncbi:unnamed protein product [Rotaria sp. Silwood1]|nr:unnamed protein product [Rotaria sp. Silwood1]CAF3333391.1 unnamed protein product [Rotaria sp. Silwood1]CAF3334987.1 unnamed protein product [Rotaria sp. Silwood1]CAF3359021.1 unnamed protein product [Rotaria sp. Silwood1]CAF4762018.1 unnamed protein product [Rotaria sp. Silwood1]
MLQADSQSRLYCAHYIPADIDCSDCRSTEKDYKNRPLYAPLYVPLPNLRTVLDNSLLKLPNAFYVPFNENPNNQKPKNNSSNYLLSDDCVEINTKNGIVRVPRSTLIQRSCLNESNKNNYELSKKNSRCNSQQIFPGDFQKHAHRFTRSFSWKTKPEESPFVQMQPLPKLIKRPGYVEICCKNICWPTHQLCLCCTRNVAESCRKWSKSTGEYDYIDACWSSCALCSDDAYKILNTPVVYNEKIIDPELLLPLDAELLYYSIQSAKRQQAKQQNFQTESILTQQQSQTSESQQDNIIPFATDKNDSKELPSVPQNQENKIKSDISHIPLQEQQQPPVIPLPTMTKTLDKLEEPQKIKPSKPVKAERSLQSTRKKNRRKKHTKKSGRSRSSSKKRSKNRSKRKSRSKR